MASGEAELDFDLQGPVVRRPISANPGLNFNLGFFFFCSKVFFRVISSLLLEHPIIKVSSGRIKLNLLLKLSYNHDIQVHFL